MKEVVIASAVRTAIGSFGGSLKDISAVKLGEIVVREALTRVSVQPEQVDEVVFGCILQAGLGQNVARQVSINSGIPCEVPAITINMVCGSGLRSVSLAFQSILTEENDIVVAGGTENMSQSPYLLAKARWGIRMGDSNVIDSMVCDGLTDVFNQYHMGITAENLAEKYKISREEQDVFALESQKKAELAISSGKFDDEIVPVTIPQRKGEPLIFKQDEYPKFGTTLDSLKNLKPAFKKDGTVTAGNASGINDGSAALVIMSKEKAMELGVEPLATILSHGSAGVDPAIMGVGVVPATKKALRKAEISIEDLGLIEANEAFAAQSLSVAKELKWDFSKVNVNGGAIALGHPVGASGARILVTLLHEMRKRDVALGLATLCIGGGMGTSVIVKKVI